MSTSWSYVEAVATPGRLSSYSGGLSVQSKETSGPGARYSLSLA